MHRGAFRLECFEQPRPDLPARGPPHRFTDSFAGNCPRQATHESGAWMTTFNDLGVRAELVAALAEQGITEPFAVQEVTIRDAMAGRDVCGKAKTGSGKTLAFGLPLLQSTQKGAAPGKPRSLVLVPTRELARQVLEVLRPLADTIGLRASAFYGGSDMDRQQK